MKISVAMCTYNGAIHLGEQLQSLSAQQRFPDELVVCDDGSTDNTMALLEDFAIHAPFSVRVERNAENLGYSRNFAKAMRLCAGDVIALADQDDIWYPEKLKRLEAAFALHPEAGGVFSDGLIMDEQSRPTKRTLWRSFRFGRADRRRFRTGHAVDALLRRNVVTGMAFAVRRFAVEFLDDMPRSWIHDNWLAMMLALRSSLQACPERLVSYRVHQTQQLGTPLTPAGKLQLLRKQGLGGYTGRVRERNLDEYRRTVVQFEDLLTFLDRKGWDDDSLRAKVRAKRDHARKGAAALERPRRQRWRILPDLGSYARFSPNGLRGFVRDLVV